MKIILPIILSSLLINISHMMIIFIIIFISWLIIFPSQLSMTSWNSQLFTDTLSFSLISLTIISLILINISSFNLPKIFHIISLICIFLILSFLSNSTLMFYIFFETTLIPTTIIIILNGKAPERIQAGIYILIYTIFGSLPLLLGFLWFNISSSLLSISIISFPFFPSMIFMIAFLIKLPMFFFHLWLPKAHVEAPLEGSMILAMVLLKLGGYGIIRLSPSLMHLNPFSKSLLISISMIGASMTSMNCLRQKDLKALIAYSSIAHMSLVLSSIITFKPIGMSASILMMFAHGLTSSALFFLVTILYNQSHSRNILIFKGILISMPNLTFWWFMFSILNLSAPPSINMISESLIFMNLLQLDLVNSLPIFFSSIMSASFSIFIYTNISHNSNFLSFPTFPSHNKIFLSLFLHFTPLLFLFMKPEIMFPM